MSQSDEVEGEIFAQAGQRMCEIFLGKRDGCAKICTGRQEGLCDKFALAAKRVCAKKFFMNVGADQFTD